MARGSPDREHDETDGLLSGARTDQGRSRASDGPSRVACGLLICIISGAIIVLARGDVWASLRAPPTTMIVRCAAEPANSSAQDNSSAHNDAAAPIPFFNWPPPLTNHSATLAASLTFRDPLAAVRRLVDAEAARAKAGLPPPILVIGGGEWALGLGNIITGLASAALLAETLGAACAFSLGEKLYAAELRPWIRLNRLGKRMAAFPCTDVSIAELEALRKQTRVPVVRVHDWRMRGVQHPHRAFIIDFHHKWHESDCVTRPDLGLLIGPPAMSPAQFWPRLRARYEEVVHMGIGVPVGAHERRIDAPAFPFLAGTGTICGHMRLLHRESHRVNTSLPSCEIQDCGGLLAAIEGLHERRPFSSFFFTAGANCAHCLPQHAPTLLRDAEHVRSPHGTARIANPGLEVIFDSAAGALADIRALSRCALVVVDDKPAGTFALTLAGAGRLTPCDDALAWLETQGMGYGTLADRIAGTFRLGDPENYLVPTLRALCGAGGQDAPPAPIKPLTGEQMRRLRDDVRYSLDPWWSPRQLSRELSPYVAPDDKSECERESRRFVKRKHKAQRAQLLNAMRQSGKAQTAVRGSAEGEVRTAVRMPSLAKPTGRFRH